MKVPMCKLCGKAHWTYEDHYTGMSAINPDYVKDRAVGAMGGIARMETLEESEARNNVTPDNNVTESSNNVTRKRGQPKKYKSAAERQRAYRERSK